jgi:acetylornithine/succinyldiaminopimelate/putrescine aminotransferase
MAYEAQKKWIKANKQIVLNTRYIREAIVLANKYNILLSEQTIEYFKRSYLGKQLKFLVSATQKKKYQDELSYLTILKYNILMDDPDARIAIHRHLDTLKKLRGKQV